MNKISFAVAAVYGASMAKAQATCQSTIALPDQQMADKMALAELNFTYLDQCVQDGKITYTEFEALVGDIGEGGADRAENVRKYQLMDLNNDNEISLVELLQHYRAKYSPIDLEGDQPPYMRIQNKLYDYLRCAPKPSSQSQDCDAAGYTRSDLKVVLPMIYPLQNIIGDHPSFESYVDHELALRDYNDDGIVDRMEFNMHMWHYRQMLGFWNHHKGRGALEELIPNDSKMTWDEFNKQDNKLLLREFAQGSIPESKLQQRFWSIDTDRDGELSWFEYFSQQQEDAKGHYNFLKLWNAINQNEDGVISRDELDAYYRESQNLTDAEIAEKVQQFYDKYNRGEENGSGDDVIEKYGEMWARIHWREEEVPNRQRRREQRQSYNFDQYHWYAYDTNRDGEWGYSELAGQLGDAGALELYDIIGKDPTIGPITYQEWKSLVTDLEWKYEFTHGYRTPQEISEIDFTQEWHQRKFGASSPTELETIITGLDLNGDGKIDQNEACRYFVLDSDYFCGGQSRELVEPTISPDFYQPTPFEIFWSEMDDAHMSADKSSVDQASWSAAVARVIDFVGMGDAYIEAQFVRYDQNADGVVTRDEAEHVYNHVETIQEVAERVEEIYESADTNMDSQLDETEFVASIEVLKTIGLIPETTTAQVLDVYDYVIDKYNETAQTPVDTVPVVAVLYLMKDVTSVAWANFLEQVEAAKNEE